MEELKKFFIFDGARAKCKQCPQQFNYKRADGGNFYDSIRRHIKKHEEGEVTRIGKRLLEKFFIFDGARAKCKQCPQQFNYKRADGGNFYDSIHRHIKKHEEGEVTRIVGPNGKRLLGTQVTMPQFCFFCFGKYAAVGTHLALARGCTARPQFYIDGLGRPLWDYKQNVSSYQQALQRFKSYQNVVKEDKNKWNVYVILLVSEGRINRVLYAGQTSNGTNRWHQHVKHKRWTKLALNGTESLSFAWVARGLSKQAANALELFTLLLLISKSKKKYGNIRFDCSFIPIHSALMTPSKTKRSEEEKYKECVETMHKAASVLIFDVLMCPNKWTPLKLDKKSVAKHKKQQLEQQRINFDY